MATSPPMEPPIRQSASRRASRKTPVGVVAVLGNVLVPEEGDKSYDVHHGQVDGQHPELARLHSESRPSMPMLGEISPNFAETTSPQTVRQTKARNHQAMLSLFMRCPRPRPPRRNNASNIPAAPPAMGSISRISEFAAMLPEQETSGKEGNRWQRQRMLLH